MIEEILIPVLILLGAGLLVGLLLTICAKAFAVKTDPTVERLRETLPGINCGACGFAGCDEYAEKAVKDGVPIGLCVPGADAVSIAMSRVLGVESVNVLAKKACISCHVCKTKETVEFEYRGVSSCRAAASYYGGDRSCRFGCLGFGDCASACDYGAITMVDGYPVVNREKCTGCGKCAKTCPRRCIAVIPENQRVTVACSNHDMGKKVITVCNSGCIACGKCARVCPASAIQVQDGLAQVIYENCIACGKCVAACPTKCILPLDPELSAKKETIEEKF